MLKTSAFAAIILTCTLGAAYATPPQVVRVKDIPYGANDTHLFLLRSLDDNMGLYSRTQTDILLVARNRSTNLDDEVWPVARSIANSPFEEAPPEGRVQAIALDGAVNPFDILSERGAEVMIGWSLNETMLSDLTLATDADQLVLMDARNDLRYRIGYADIGKLLTDNLNRSRAAVPAYFAEADVDVLYDAGFDAQADCTFAPSMRFTDGQEQVAQLVALTCQNDETMAPISTYLVMPPEG